MVTALLSSPVFRRPLTRTFASSPADVPSKLGIKQQGDRCN